MTPLEPGWGKDDAIEFSKYNTITTKIYANEGVAQLVFIKGNEKPKVTYAKRKVSI